MAGMYKVIFAYVIIPLTTFSLFLYIFYLIWIVIFRSDVNIRNKNGGTSLIIASDINDVSTVNKLLDRGANLKIQDIDGNTALHRAVINGNFQISAALVNADYKVLDVQNRDGVTALMYAILWDQTRLAMALIDQGARVDLRDVYGRDALAYCDVYVRPVVRKYVLSKLGE